MAARVRSRCCAQRFPPSLWRRGGAASAEAAPAGTAAAAEPAATRFPTAWLVLVALCALVGAVAGTRLAARQPKG